MNAYELRERLVSRLSESEKIVGIGQTGDPNAPLISGNSDIDLFVLCTEVPQKAEREGFYASIEPREFSVQPEMCCGGQWGWGDILNIDGIDVMPMYFTVREMSDYLGEVLDGKHLEKEGRFYPVGRLATVEGINVLYEAENAWSGLINRLKEKPEEFFKKWYFNELWQIIDEEDLGRSALRKDPLFFHQVLENALDHFLQALFAVNRRYFPSRKRNAELIDGFDFKPDNCCGRLLKMIENGSRGETIEKAIEELRKIAAELSDYGKTSFK